MLQEKVGHVFPAVSVSVWWAEGVGQPLGVKEESQSWELGEGE